jgi:hypothetical protein
MALEEAATFSERSGVTQVQLLAVPAELARLDGLIDHCERGMVALLDSRGILEDRIQGVLSKSPGGDVSLNPWDARGDGGPGCGLSETLASFSHRLERLVDSMSAEEQQLRSIASRVQL